jgi:Flp pilus assembly protein TadG
MRDVLRSFIKLLRDRHVAIMLALSAAPLLVMVGLGVDYHRKLAYKSQMEAAAAIAAIEAKNVSATASAQNPSDLLSPEKSVVAAKTQDKVLCSTVVPARATTQLRPQVSIAPQPPPIQRPFVTPIAKFCGPGCKNTYWEAERDQVRRHKVLWFRRPTRLTTTRPPWPRIY